MAFFPTTTRFSVTTPYARRVKGPSPLPNLIRWSEFGDKCAKAGSPFFPGTTVGSRRAPSLPSGLWRFSSRSGLPTDVAPALCVPCPVVRIFGISKQGVARSQPHCQGSSCCPRRAGDLRQNGRVAKASPIGPSRVAHELPVRITTVARAHKSRQYRLLSKIGDDRLERGHDDRVKRGRPRTQSSEFAI